MGVVVHLNASFFQNPTSASGAERRGTACLALLGSLLLLGLLLLLLLWLLGPLGGRHLLLHGLLLHGVLRWWLHNHMRRSCSALVHQL